MFRKRKWKRSKGYVTKVEGRIFVACVYFGRHRPNQFTVSYFRMRDDPQDSGFVRPLSLGEARDLGWVLVRAFAAAQPRRIGRIFWLWRPRN